MEVDLVQACSAAQFAAARSLMEEYAAKIAAALGVDLGFQNFDLELERLPDMYGPPSGCLLLLRSGAEWVGCGALRRFSDGVCEMKRLYLQPHVRGARLGRQLAERLVGTARELGYQRMVLDTVEDMLPAQGLYLSLGFRRIAPYYFNPMPGVSYMALNLATAQIPGFAS